MGVLSPLSLPGTLISLTVLGLLYTGILVIYRLWFSPISHFPGPFLARVTYFYEFYHNWFKLGTFYLRVKEMHDKYGS